MFDFSSANDAGYLQNMGPDFVSALKEDEKKHFIQQICDQDFLFYLQQGFMALYKINYQHAIILVGLLMVSDLFFVDKITFLQKIL
jgi:hypothetical protein